MEEGFVPIHLTRGLHKITEVQIWIIDSPSERRQFFEHFQVISTHGNFLNFV